ncbi:Glycosyl hydrolases family 2 [Singulisphaera sp. GP187]|uniref:glycoside hydrolase family 2 protein n=1 Tax=Singulisphaera sp. GP187 TaxID=1882752 RepID=UPI00092CD7B5|nr:glycoside hydrolase family 2 [Singulisphaera sp. GP187]SIO66868.1 Glycosyl hydrolases family 2 [Singulisphaera sp. GP187]
MNTKRVALLWLGLAVGSGLSLVRAADWKPKQGPLTTRWAKDVQPDRVHPEYPRPQLVRKDWLNLNGLWQLGFGKEGEAPPVGRALDEQILVPFPVESALSGVMKHADRLWYRRAFHVPKQWNGRRVLLHFGAVDWEATVWVNGKELGTHRGGYDPFELDVTDFLKPEGDQELIVRVFDPTDRGTQPRGKQVLNPNGIYYTPITGIWQTVWLEPVSPARIKSLKIVPDVDGGKAQITVVGAGDNAGLTAEVVALDGEKTVATVRGSVGQPIDLPIAQAKLWSPDSPFLYDLRVELKRDGEVVDSATSYFGMRKVALGPDEKGITRLLVNGKFVFQVGPLDQGFWPDGLYTAPTDEALRYDIEITKKLGYNTTRKHVKVEPDRWYYWCDRLGLLVWQDMPSGDQSIAPGKPDLVRTPESAKQYEVELKAMIAGFSNHPSIIMWVVFNEGWGQFETARMTALTKSLDPSRLANCASGWNDHAGVGDLHDIHVYPGPAAPPTEPNRAAVLGEFGGLGLGVDGHTWAEKTWGYRGAASKDDLTRKYERLLQRSWNLKESSGLSAAIYTQITDVETEANGLLTYDREIIKVDVARVAAVNNGTFTTVLEEREVVPTSRETPQDWSYTFEAPAAAWFQPDFDASSWKTGPGGFGTKGTPNAVVRTDWSSPDIWIRREVELPASDVASLVLVVHHDEDLEVYLNGVLAAKAAGYGTEYEEMPISDAARATLRPGKKNVIAVHCHQTGGGQYVDVGIGEFKSRPR